MSGDADTDRARLARRARWIILLAAVMWSTSGLFAKANVFAQWPETGLIPNRSVLLIFWRAVFATAVLLPFVRRPCWSWKLIPAALIFVVMNITFLSAMVRTTAANAIWLQNTAPLWVFLIGTTVLRDPIHPRDWLQLAFVLSGVAIILGFELPGNDPTGVLWGVAGGVMYAGVVLSLRWLRDIESAWLIAWNHAVTAVVLLPWVWSIGTTPTPVQFGFLVAFGALQMGIPYLLFASSVRTLPAHEAAGIVLLEPILVPVWVMLAWGEYPSWWTVVGGACIFAGLVVRYLPMRKTAVPLRQ